MTSVAVTVSYYTLASMKRSGLAFGQFTTAESVVLQINDSHLIAECLGNSMVYDMTHTVPK